MSAFSQKKTGILNFMDLKKARIKMLYWSLLVLSLIIALTCILPPLWILLSSLKNINEFYQIPPTILPKTFELEKVMDAWKKLNFFRYYINTLELAAGAIVLAIVINGLAGYVISRLKPKGSKVFMTLMLCTMLLPSSVSMVPLFKNMVKFPILGINLTNTYWPMWLLAGASAYNVLIFKGFFDSIPMSLIEAAKLDGCGNIGIFQRVILPLSKPIISVIVIFTLNATWGDFLWPYLVLKDPQKYTVMVKIFTMRGTSGFAIDVQMLALVFAIFPPVVLFLIFQKNIMHGFTLSGIKG